MEKIKNALTKIKEFILVLKEWILTVLFGRMKGYEVTITKESKVVVGGRGYKIDRAGRLTIYVGFDKIATFRNFDTIIEL